MRKHSNRSSTSATGGTVTRRRTRRLKRVVERITRGLGFRAWGLGFRVFMVGIIANSFPSVSR